MTPPPMAKTRVRARVAACMAAREVGDLTGSPKMPL